MRSDNPFRWNVILAFGAIYIVWGSTYIAIKYAVETIPPFMMMGVRSLVAGVILYVWGRVGGGGRVQREHWRSLVIIGVSFFLIGHGLLAWAQQEVPSGLAALIITSEPLCILTIESLFLRDARVGRYGTAGLILGFAGMVLLVASSQSIGLSQADLTGVGAILIGTVSWGAGAVYTRVAILPKSPRVAAGMELIVGGSMLLACSVLLGEPRSLNIDTVSTRSLIGLSYLIVFGSVITFSAYVWLLSFTSATRVSTHVNPVIAVLIGWMVAGEVLTIPMVVAAVMILTSVLLVLQKQGESSRPPSLSAQELDSGSG